jgi:hypothetical protein
VGALPPGGEDVLDDVVNEVLVDMIRRARGDERSM